MNLTDTLLGEAWYWAAWVVWVPLFALCVFKAPWGRLRDPERLNVWLGMVVLLALIWSLRAGVKPGLALHLLGATVFTLSFGPSLAFVGLSFVALGVALNDGAGAFAYAMNVLLLGGLGVFLSQGLYRVFFWIFPRHFFVYIFINAFLGSALTIIGVGFGICALLALAGAYSWDYLVEEYFVYFLLLGFSEAWLSGMVMTLFVIYRPNWVFTFDDTRYLAGK